MPAYTRTSPSARYREMMGLYARMHREGETQLGSPAELTFPGSSRAAQVARIKRLIGVTEARTILDYGAGKGTQYRPHPVIVDGTHVADGIAEYWDVDEVRCFDPGYAPPNGLTVFGPMSAPWGRSSKERTSCVGTSPRRRRCGSRTSSPTAGVTSRA